MNSKKADTRGVRLSWRVVSMRQLRVNSATGPSTRTRSGSASPRGCRQRRQAQAGFGKVNRSQYAAAGGHHFGAWGDLLAPHGRAVAGQGVVKPDPGVLSKVLQAGRAAMLRQIVAAAIHRPQRVGDLAPDQPGVHSVVRPKRHIGLAFAQVDVAVAHHKLDLQTRMARRQALEQPGLADAQHDRLRAGQPDDAIERPRRRLHKALQRQHVLLDPLSMQQQSQAVGRQAVAGGAPLDQVLADALLQSRQASLHG